LTLLSQMALMEDPVFKEWVLKYAKDQSLFFKDFANAFGKLIELGVDRDDSGFAHLVRKAAKEGKPLDEVSKENGGEGGRVTVKSAGGGCPFMAAASSAKRDSKL
jgi:cytochrome c peroxidase